MKFYIGIDLGTSAMKLSLVDENGAIRNSVTKEYPLIIPQPGWSEQNPVDWWGACLMGLEELLDNSGKSAVAGIGVGGQMHGLVTLDDNDEVIRDAILWNDGRTAEERQAFQAPKQKINQAMDVNCAPCTLAGGLLVKRI